MLNILLSFLSTDHISLPHPQVTSVESFVLNVRTRRDSQLAFQLKRMVPLDVFTGQVRSSYQHPLTHLHFSSERAHWIGSSNSCTNCSSFLILQRINSPLLHD